MAETNNNSPVEQVNTVEVEERNQFLKLDEEEIIPFDDEEEAKSKEEKEIDYRSPQFIEYFTKKEVSKSGYQSMVNNIVKMCHLNFKEKIQAGHTSVSPESKNLNNLVPAQSKKDQEQKQLSKSRISEISPPPHHKQFVEKMNKARKVSEQKRKLKIQYEESKRQALFKKEQEKRRENEEKLRLQKQKQIKEKLQEKSKVKEKQKEQRLESIKRYKSVVSEKRRHELMAEKYESNVEKPLLEERSKILEARRKRLKGYSIDEIRNFQMEYSRKEEERMASSSKVKEDWSYTPPPIQPRLHQIIQQEKIRERIKMEEKKRALEEKISRQQYYAQYLKETIIATVKIDEKKRQELEKLNAKRENRSKSKSERWKLGNNYLTEILSKIKAQPKDKKDSYSTQQEPHKQALPSQKQKSNTSMGNHHEYDKRINMVHEKRINRLLSSNTIEKQQKLSELKVQVDKLNERAKWKEEVGKLNPGQKDNDGELQVLLSSIKAKIGIMSLYRH